MGCEQIHKLPDLLTFLPSNFFFQKKIITILDFAGVAAFDENASAVFA